MPWIAELSTLCNQMGRLAMTLCIALSVTFSMGCRSLEVRDRWFDSDRVAEVPNEVMPIWTDTVLHQPGKPGVRGFGGRVYFYEDGKPDPVKVDGQLVVYAFDSEVQSPTNAAPLKKFIFTPDQLQKQCSKSSLGNSYSVWIPWDRVGGETRTLSLVARFDGRSGGTMLSKPSRVLLPGVQQEASYAQETKSSTISNPSGGVELVSHTEEIAAKDAWESSTLSTDSIDLPPSFQRRLWQAHAKDSTTASDVSFPKPSPGTNYQAATYPETLQQNQPLQVGDNEPRLQRDIARPTPGLVSDPVRATDRQWDEGEGAFRPATRLRPQRFPARRTPKVQPGPSVLRRQPHLAGWPDGLPPTPRPGSASKSVQDFATPIATGPTSELR